MLCRATETTPGITLVEQYPCNNASVLTRTAFLATQLPSTLLSYLTAIHPSHGPYPNEVWHLHYLCVLLLGTCLLLARPQLYLHLRPWLWNVVSLTATLSPFLGLLTHPHAPPSLYWTDFWPVAGVMLISMQFVFRVGVVVTHIADSRVGSKEHIILVHCMFFRHHGVHCGAPLLDV